MSTDNNPGTSNVFRYGGFRGSKGNFGAVYTVGQLYRELSCRSPVYFVNRRMIPVVEKYLSDHHYDIVIMTHLKLYPFGIPTNSVFAKTQSKEEPPPQISVSLQKS